MILRIPWFYRPVKSATYFCFYKTMKMVSNKAFSYLFQCHVEIWPFDKGRRLGQRRVPCVRVCDPWPTRSKWSLPSIGERLNLVTSPVKLKFGFSSQFFSKSNTVDITEGCWAQFLTWIFNFGPYGQLRVMTCKLRFDWLDFINQGQIFRYYGFI